MNIGVFPAFPIALVTSKADDKTNIITLAMLHVFSFNPFLVGIGVAPTRYSYELIKKSREFVVNLPTKDMRDVVELCGSCSGRYVNKFERAGLTPRKSEKVAPPQIAECPVALECKVIKEIKFGDHVWFIGEVVAQRVEVKDLCELLCWWFNIGYAVSKPLT